MLFCVAAPMMFHHHAILVLLGVVCHHTAAEESVGVGEGQNLTGSFSPKAMKLSSNIVVE